MRKLLGPAIIAILVAIAAYWALSSQQNAPLASRIAVGHSRFSEVFEPGRTKHEISLCNRSGETLVLSGLSRSCSCLRPMLDEVILPPKQTVVLPIEMVFSAPETPASAPSRHETYTLAGRLAIKNQPDRTPDKFSCTISAQIEPHPVVLTIESPNVIVVPGQPDQVGCVVLSSDQQIAGLRHSIEGADAEHLVVEAANLVPAKRLCVQIRATSGIPAGNRTVVLTVHPTTSTGRELPGLVSQLGLSVTGRAMMVPERIVLSSCYAGEPIPISIGIAFCNGGGEVQQVTIEDRSVPFEVIEQNKEFATIQCQFEAVKSGNQNIPLTVHCHFGDGTEVAAHGTCLVLVRERASSNSPRE